MTVTSKTDPAWVEDLRDRRADAIVRVLTDAGITVNDAAHATKAMRERIHARAGLSVGSGKTWRRAVEIMAGSRTIACPGCLARDPDGPRGPVQPVRHPGQCTQ